MRERHVNPPRRNKLDEVRTLTKAAVAIIPFVGGALGELFERFVPSPIANKEEAFKTDLSRGLTDISRELEGHLHPELVLSDDAKLIAIELTRRSERGRDGDPRLSGKSLRALLPAASDQQISEAVDELKRAGLVDTLDTIVPGELGSLWLEATSRLFLRFDKEAMGWDTVSDAVVVARKIYETDGAAAANLCSELGWAPRRLNPALSILIGNDLVLDSKEIQPDFVSSSGRPNPSLGVWLKGKPTNR